MNEFASSLAGTSQFIHSFVHFLMRPTLAALPFRCYSDNSERTDATERRFRCHTLFLRQALKEWSLSP